jgi:GH24 family phage-related lysozyme (muramidase)
MSSLFEFIKKFEGFKAGPYNDGVGKTTIGDGFNIMENKIALQLFSCLS